MNSASYVPVWMVCGALHVVRIGKSSKVTKPMAIMKFSNGRSTLKRTLILIVDEVLAVGDAAFQRKCLGKMESVASEGRTVLFVSHQMDAVQRLCNKGILLDKGAVVATGSMRDVVRTLAKLTKMPSAVSGRR